MLLGVVIPTECICNKTTLGREEVKRLSPASLPTLEGWSEKNPAEAFAKKQPARFRG